MKTDPRFQSLKTTDLAEGVALSAELAQFISDRMDAARPSLPKPGGTNFGEPAPVSRELIAGILMVAVTIANDGWAK